MRRNPRWLPLALALAATLASSCTSLWQQREEQAVIWEDGDPARIEVWLSQGSLVLGQPWLFLLDVVATPVLVVNETFFALAASDREDARIAGGPFGYLASLLPGITCMPLDARPSVWLRLNEPLRLPRSERERLAKLGPCGGVNWLAEHYARQDERGALAAEFVRSWVASVRLVPIKKEPDPHLIAPPLIAPSASGSAPAAAPAPSSDRVRAPVR